jgi:hypothetical protein
MTQQTRPGLKPDAHRPLTWATAGRPAWLDGSTDVRAQRLNTGLPQEPGAWSFGYRKIHRRATPPRSTRSYELDPFERRGLKLQRALVNDITAVQAIACGAFLERR